MDIPIKYINKFLFLIKKKWLKNRLKKFRIENYTINIDGTIDVDGNVDLQGVGLTTIPFNFNEVSGYFDCSFNKLTTLQGCPIEIGRYFNCSNNNLTSLEYCPSEIGGNFACSENQLTMLDCSSYVKGDIYCYGNVFTEEPEFFGDYEGKIKWQN